MKRMKFEFRVPEASFYVWVKVPRGYSSETFTEHMIREAGVIVTPGTGFGPEGQGFVRFALTIPEARIKEGLTRIEKALK
jgi:LL-diaminopimelate aminotransferase